MNIKVFCICLLFVASHNYGQSQYSLSISISTETNQGEVLLGLYNGPDLYLEEDGMFRHCQLKIEGNTTICKWDNLPPGNYSAAVLIDKNGNRKMDFSWVGWPKEAYGFYPDPGFLMRKPKWKECNFELTKDTEVVLELRNQ